MWHTLQINAHSSATSFEINRHLKCEIDRNWKTIVLIYLLANKENKTRSSIFFYAMEIATLFLPSIFPHKQQSLKHSQPQSNSRAGKWRPLSFRAHWISTYHNTGLEISVLETEWKSSLRIALWGLQSKTGVKDLQMDGGLISRNFRESYVHNFQRKIISSKIKKMLSSQKILLKNTDNTKQF